jgi:hypothetical protein
MKPLQFLLTLWLGVLSGFTLGYLYATRPTGSLMVRCMAAAAEADHWRRRCGATYELSTVTDGER